MHFLSYVITTNADASIESGRTVEYPELILNVVEELSGRNCRPWFDKSMRQTGRCYVACNRGSVGREQYGQGFVVRRHPDAA